MRLSFTVLFLSITLFAKAQTWSQAEYNRANTAVNANYLTSEEKNIIMYINLIRLEGEKFYYTFLQDYINNYNSKVKKYRNYNKLKITPNNSYYVSLLKHVKGIKNLSLLYPNDKLASLSKAHAQDLNLNNLADHTSSNGDSFSKRLSKYFAGKPMSENISFGYYNSLDIVCQLLLDCGVPSLGHRFVLLDQKSNLNTVGVNIQSHPSYTWCAVIDYVSLPNLSK
jgi:hypothetical protein